MIDPVLLDAGGRDLLNLHRWTTDQALFVKQESLPDVMPVGTVEEVALTGLKIFVGSDRLRAGTYTLTLGTYGRSHPEAFALQREVMRCAVLTRAIQRTSGGVLPIARFSKISRSFKGGAQLGGQMDVAFEATSPYWITGTKTRAVVPGATQLVPVNGDAPAPLRVTITAGASAVTDPSILSDAGLTTWHGTIPAGQTLVLDGQDVTLGSLDVSLALTGPQPYLEPGDRNITITASGATAEIEWEEGEL